MGARSTDSARVLKFTKELSGQMIVVGTMSILLHQDDLESVTLLKLLRVVLFE